MRSGDISSAAWFYFFDLRHPGKAKAILAGAMKKDEGNNNKVGLASDYETLADFAREEHHPTLVDQYLDKALVLARESKEPELLCVLENDIAWATFLKKDYEKAYSLAVEAVNLKAAGPVNVAYAQGTLGCIYRDAPDDILRKAGISPAQRYQRSLELTLRAVDYGKKINDFGLIDG